MTITNLHLLIGLIRKSGLNRYQLTMIVDEIDYSDNDNAKEWNSKLAKQWMDVLKKQEEIKKEQNLYWERSA